MKNGILWKVLLVIGLILFAAPFGIFLFLSIRDSVSLVDCLLIFGIFNWPIYLAGAILMILSFIVRSKR